MWYTKNSWDGGFKVGDIVTYKKSYWKIVKIVPNYNTNGTENWQQTYSHIHIEKIMSKDGVAVKSKNPSKLVLSCIFLVKVTEESILESKKRDVDKWDTI